MPSRPYFRYQAEFRNAQGDLLHRAVQCSLSNNEIEGFSFINSADEGPVYMCDWPVDGSTPAGGRAPLSPYFEQQPRMTSREAVQVAVTPRTAADAMVFSANTGFSVIETVDILLNMKPRGDGRELPASVVFSLTDWAGTLSAYRPGSFPRSLCSSGADLPLEQQYFDRTSTSLLTFEEGASAPDHAGHNRRSTEPKRIRIRWAGQ